MALELLVILVVDGVRALGDLDGEIEHRLLPRLKVGLAMIDRDLIGDQRVLGADAEDRAVSDDAILAIVDPRGRDHDHLALGLA